MSYTRRNMHYHFKTHKEGKFYWAECLELKGCVTQAYSKRELQKNIVNVLNFYLDEPADSQLVFPLPRKNFKGRNIIKIKVEPTIAFAFSLRRLRLTKKMTQKQAAASLGLKNIYSYQRLESSKTANPSLLTLVGLKLVFPELNLDQVSS